MLTILKDWRNASEDTAVERWKNLGMLENLDQEEAKKCAACFDLMGIIMLKLKSRTNSMVIIIRIISKAFYFRLI